HPEKNHDRLKSHDFPSSRTTAIYLSLKAAIFLMTGLSRITFSLRLRPLCFACRKAHHPEKKIMTGLSRTIFLQAEQQLYT
ncbi:MAG: hypothetical protein NWS37_08475, partial [Flavobacteriaceae bacterium]|nr:hypothetical protein [Flavobacteriaceae bacterium]